MPGSSTKVRGIRVTDVATAGDHVVEPGQLGDAQGRENVREPVVVTDLGVLVPRRRIPRLGGEMTRARQQVEVVTQQHPSTGRGEDLVAVERERRRPAEGAGGPAVTVGTEGLGRVLDEGYAALAQCRDDARIVDHPAEQVDGHDGADVTALRAQRVDGIDEQRWVDVAVAGVRVDEDGLRARVHDRVGGCRERHRRDDHQTPCSRADVEEGEMKGRRPG